MDYDIRDTIRNVLRTKLLGKENLYKKHILMERLNITDSTIKSWMVPSGTNIPSTDYFLVICEVLDITLNELFGISNPYFTEKELLVLKAYKNANDDFKLMVERILDIK